MRFNSLLLNTTPAFRVSLHTHFKKKCTADFIIFPSISLVIELSRAVRAAREMNGPNLLEFFFFLFSFI